MDKVLIFYEPHQNNHAAEAHSHHRIYKSVAVPAKHNRRKERHQTLVSNIRLLILVPFLCHCR